MGVNFLNKNQLGFKLRTPQSGKKASVKFVRRQNTGDYLMTISIIVKPEQDNLTDPPKKLDNSPNGWAVFSNGNESGHSNLTMDVRFDVGANELIKLELGSFVPTGGAKGDHPS
jgi:hypothetical protein